MPTAAEIQESINAAKYLLIEKMAFQGTDQWKHLSRLYNQALVAFDKGRGAVDPRLIERLKEAYSTLGVLNQ